MYKISFIGFRNKEIPLGSQYIKNNPITEVQIKIIACTACEFMKSMGLKRIDIQIEVVPDHELSQPKPLTKGVLN